MSQLSQVLNFSSSSTSASVLFHLAGVSYPEWMIEAKNVLLVEQKPKLKWANQLP